MRTSWIAPFLWIVSVSVAADDDHNNEDRHFEQLKTKDGLSPCKLQERLHVPCPGGDSNEDSSPSFSVCTCNTVYFSVWSACRLSENESANASFTTWESACKEASILVLIGDYPPLTPGEVHIPAWTRLELKDGLFDLAAAIHATHRWTTLQILAPIIVGVSLTTIFVILIIWYRKRNKREQVNGEWKGATLRSPTRLGFWPKERPRPVRPTHKASWSIEDLSHEMDHLNGPAHRSGHVRLGSSSLADERKTQAQTKMKRVRSWRNPFKGKPVPVVNKVPSRGFRIDDTDLASAAQSRQQTMDGLVKGTRADGPDGHELEERMLQAVKRQDDEDDEWVDVGEEHSALSPKVMLISSMPGVDFTITPSSDSHGPTNMLPRASVEPSFQPLRRPPSAIAQQPSSSSLRTKLLQKVASREPQRPPGV